MEPSTDPSPSPIEANRRGLTIAVLRSVFLAVGVLVVYFTAPLGTANVDSVALRSTIAVLVLVAVVIGQTYAVLHSDTPALRAIEALSVSLSVLLVTAAAVYLIISGSDEAAFTEPLEHIDALYLSMMTMTTVGFGDIGALSSGARIAVMAQLVLNVVVLGVAARVFLNRARTGAREKGWKG